MTLLAAGRYSRAKASTCSPRQPRIAIGNNTQLQADGKNWAYQPFARDTLYTEIPNWGDVRRLSTLLGGSIPPAIAMSVTGLVEPSVRIELEVDAAAGEIQ